MEFQTLKPLPRYVAGVDPGQSTGIGVFDRKLNEIVFIHTTDFFGVTNFFLRMLRISELKVYVEVPKMFMYDRNDEHEDKVRDRMLVNIGGNRREAELLAGQLRKDGFEVEEVPPIPKEKWTVREFKQMTRSKRDTNQHERDACRIAFIYANKR